MAAERRYHSWARGQHDVHVLQITSRQTNAMVSEGLGEGSASVRGEDASPLREGSRPAAGRGGSKELSSVPTSIMLLCN